MYFMHSLHMQHEESISHIFSHCFIALQIWICIQQVLPELFIHSIEYLIYFLKNASSSLVTVCCYLFHLDDLENKEYYLISICTIIHKVKGYFKLTSNASKKSTHNDVIDFSILKFLSINVRNVISHRCGNLYQMGYNQ